MTRTYREYKAAMVRAAAKHEVKLDPKLELGKELWGPAARRSAAALALAIQKRSCDGELDLRMRRMLAPYLRPTFKIRRSLSLYNFTRYSGDRGVQFIVLHHTASRGSASAVVSYFQRITSKAASHYVVGKPGDIWQVVLERHAAWHAGRGWYDWNRDKRISAEERQLNEHSIGIEIVNAGDGRDPFPEAQVRAVAWLVGSIMERYPALQKRDITDHKAVNKTDGKIDMRANWPWARFFDYLEEYRTER